MPLRKWTGERVDPRHDSKTLAKAWVKLDVDENGENQTAVIRILRKIYIALQPRPVKFQSSTHRNKLKVIILESLDQMPAEVQAAAKRNRVRTIQNLYRVVQLERVGWNPKSPPRRPQPRRAPPPRGSRPIRMPKFPLPHGGQGGKGEWENTGESDYEPPDQVRDEESETESEKPGGGSEIEEAEGSETTESHGRTPFPPPWISSAPKEGSPGTESEEESEEDSEKEPEQESGSEEASEYDSDDSVPVPPHKQSPPTPSRTPREDSPEMELEEELDYRPNHESEQEGGSEAEPEQKSGNESEDSDPEVSPDVPMHRPSHLKEHLKEASADERSEEGSKEESEEGSEEESEQETGSEAARDYDPKSDASEEGPKEDQEEQDSEIESGPMEVDEAKSSGASPVVEEPEQESEEASGDEQSSDIDSEHSVDKHISSRKASPDKSEAGSEEEQDQESEEESDNGSEHLVEGQAQATSHNASPAISSEELEEEPEEEVEPESGDDVDALVDEGQMDASSEDELEEASESSNDGVTGDESEAKSEIGSEDGAEDNRPGEESDDHVYVSSTSKSDTEAQDEPDYESNGEDQTGEESENQPENETDNGSDVESQGTSIVNQEYDSDELEFRGSKRSYSELERKIHDDAEDGFEDGESDRDEKTQASSAKKVKTGSESLHEELETEPESSHDEEMEDVSEDEAKTEPEGNRNEELETEPESSHDEEMEDVSSAEKSKSDESMKDASSAEKSKSNRKATDALPAKTTKTDFESSHDEEMVDAEEEDEAGNETQASPKEEQKDLSDDGSEDESENDSSEGSSGEEQEDASDNESDDEVNRDLQDGSTDDQDDDAPQDDDKYDSGTGSEDGQDDASAESGDEPENDSELGSSEEQESESNVESGIETENDSEEDLDKDEGHASPDELEAEDVSAGSSDEERQDSPEAELFDFNRSSVVPNADVDIIRAEDPYRALSIRLNDFLKDRADPRCQSLDGDWIDISQLRINVFRKRLMNEGLFRLGADNIWWKPSALKDINFNEVDIPQGDESRLTELSMITIIKRSINAYYPGLGITMIDEERLGLPRPSFTVIIRNAKTEGGMLDRSREPSLSCPNSAMSSRYASSPGRGQLGRSRINSSAASSATTKKRTEPEGKHESAESDVDDTPQTSGEKRKSPDSEVDPSSRPTRRTRPSPEPESLDNYLQSHDSLQLRNANAQETSDPADEARAFPEEASYNPPKPRGMLDNLDLLQFHDALKFVETASVRGPETTSSAGSIVSPQNQAFANYREGAGHSATTIEGISPLVPLAQESHGGDLWVHHKPVSPPKSYLSGKEQRLNNILTAVGHSPRVRLRNLSISSPRPPVPNSESSLFIQLRVPPKMDQEKHSKLAIGMRRNVKPSSELSGRPPTSSPAFTPSSKPSPEDHSPPSPVGSPPNINWAAMRILTRLSIGHTDSVEKHSPFHVHPPSHPKNSPRAKAPFFSRQSDQDRPEDGGVYQSVKKVFGAFLGGLPNLPLINLIPVFNNTVNVPKVEIPPANLPPLNLRAEISGYDSADNVSNDYTKKETMEIRKRSIHFETNRPNSEAQEIKQLRERKKRQLGEIEELEIEINRLMEFGTEQEEKVGELKELIEELEQERDDLEEKIGIMTNELGELREVRDDLTRALNRGWTGQDRLNRRMWDTKGDTKEEGSQSWSRRRRKNLSDESSPTRGHERSKASRDGMERNQTRQRREESARSSQESPPRAPYEQKTKTTNKRERAVSQGKKEETESGRGC